MKNISLLILLFSPLWMAGQQWQNICSPGVTRFSNPATHLASFRLDSAKLVQGTVYDTQYYSYPTVHKPEGQSCYDTVTGSVLGNRVIRRVNGSFVFFNRTGDSIYLKPDAALQQSWRMMTLPNQAYLQATVTAISNDTVCGLPDQVKVITLQAKNAANQNIQHLFNNRTIELSQNYGINRIFYLPDFPADTIPWILAGKDTPPVGLQDFSLADAYNYNVGDEFHIEEYHGNSMGSMAAEIIHVILSKNVSATGDTIIYLTEECMRYWNSGQPWPSYSHSTRNDTSILHNHLFFNGFSRQPTEFYPKPDLYCDLYDAYASPFNGREVKRIYYRNTVYNPASACWVYHQTYPWYEYSPGIGQTQFYDKYVTYSPPQFITTTHTIQLVYFRKGTETWGTPLAPFCTAILGEKDRPAPGTAGVTVTPNPFHDQAEINVSGLNPDERGRVILYDYVGREVFRTEVASNPFILTRENIPDGIYLLQVIPVSGRRCTTAKVIIY